MRKANKTLAALAPFKNPHVEALARNRNTYRGVTFTGEVSHVRFEYMPEDGIWDNDFLTSFDYDLSETGKLDRVPSLVYSPNLAEIWECGHIRDNILSRLPYPERSITFDLDKHTASQAPPVILNINHAFRE